MATYPCSRCGATADTATGCPNCGSTLDAEVAELNLTILSMQQRNKSMVEARSALMARLQGAIAIRSLLQQARQAQSGPDPVRSRLGRVIGGAQKPMSIPVKPRRKAARSQPKDGRADAMGVPRQAAPAESSPAESSPAESSPAESAPAARVSAEAGGAQGRTTKVSRATAQAADAPTTAGSRSPRQGPPSQRSPRLGPRQATPAGSGRPGERHLGHPPHPPETTTRTTQNLVLALGAIVMVGAIGMIPFFYASLASGLKALSLVVLTAAAVGLPIMLGRWGLSTTSEWLTPVPLMFILVDGWALWGAAIHGRVPGPAYAGAVFAAAAGVAAGYQRLTGLAVPRFASILLLQPVPALVLHASLHDTADWAAVMTATAAADLLIALRSRRTRTHGVYLRFAIRRLQEAVNLAAVVYGSIALLRANEFDASIRAGAAVVAAAVVGLAAGLLIREFPTPQIATGVATLASIGGFAKMAAFAVPGSGLLAAAAAIAAHAVAVRLLPSHARRGAQVAAAAAAAATAVEITHRGWQALAAPIRAATPAWTADLGAYHQVVAAHAGRAAALLVPAMLVLSAASWTMLPRTWRLDGVLAGLALAAMLVPGTYALGWPGGIAVCLAASLGLGALGLRVKTERESWVCIATALAVGLYGAGLSIARPWAQTAMLLAIALAGAAIGALGMRAPGKFNLHVAEAGWGAAAFALPGAVAAFTAAVARPATAPDPTAILAASFVATAGTLAAAAISQVARRRSSPLIALGATLGAMAVAVASISTDGVSHNDVAVAFTLLVSAGLMCIPVIAPNIGQLRDRRFLGLDADEFAAAAVTVAVIAALARVAALVVGGSTAVVMAGLVLLIAIGARSMPAEWRRGPVAGATVVGTLVGLAVGFGALDAAVAVIRTNHPIWDVAAAGWAGHVATLANDAGRSPFTPLALLFLAAAAATVLSRRNTQIAVCIAAGFTALALPVTIHTGWWGPGLFSGATAAALGVLAAATLDRGASLATAAVATTMFADTIAVSLTSPAATAATLIAAAAVNGAVTWTAARTLRHAGRRTGKASDHLTLVGGGALSGGVLTVAGGAGAAAVAGGASAMVVTSCGLAGLLAALGVIAAFRRALDPFLLHATASISLGGLAIACANIGHLSTLGAFASFAAGLSVVAELVRASQRSRPPVHKWLARRSVVLAAAGPTSALAIASLAPTLLASIVGPYQVIGSVWDHHPRTSIEELGTLGHLVGGRIGILTALIMTITLTLGAIGFGGTREFLVGRAVAVITPGVAATLLIAPFVLGWQWPAGPVFALLVGSISGLAIAFSVEPASTDAASALRAARKLVLVLCVVGGGTGVAGSLATRSTTALAMAMATATGLAAALWGRTVASRVSGWVVTAMAAELLALVLCVTKGLDVASSSFAVGGVAATLLLLGALLPRLRTAIGVETITVEASAYAGGVMGLVLATEEIRHLAAFLGAWGAALGISAVRATRPRVYRSILLWTAAAHELAAWCILVSVSADNVPPEAYTLGVAVVALVTGWIELRWNPDLTSWVTYGVALTAALGPSLAITIGADHATARDLFLLAAAAVSTAVGSIRRQQAPTIIGGFALLGTIGNNIARYSPTASLVVLMVIVSAVLISIGANYEKRRRNIRTVWHVFHRMR